jgi:hypothetical protein
MHSIHTETAPRSGLQATAGDGSMTIHLIGWLLSVLLVPELRGMLQTLGPVHCAGGSVSATTFAPNQWRSRWPTFPRRAIGATPGY